jgi:hypothetical protein
MTNQAKVSNALLWVFHCSLRAQGRRPAAAQYPFDPFATPHAVHFGGHIARAT